MWKIGNVKIKNQIVFAPMAGVSNLSYRLIIKSMGAGLIYTEMISNMGIVYKNKKTIDMLKLKDEERPVSLQIFGNDVKSFVEAAKYVDEYIKPDIIDINMGCPVPKIATRCQAGSALLKDIHKIEEIVSSVVNSVSIPVSVKIRSGWDSEHINAVEVAKICEKAGASCVCVHARTRSQGYTGKADLEIIKNVKESVSIPVIGNGDIFKIEDAKKMLEFTKCDAIMIGRGSLGNPWFFKECVEYIEKGNIIDKPSDIDKINMIRKHYDLLKQEKTEKTALLEIRQHALWYLKGLKYNAIYKNKFMSIKNEKELYDLIEELKLNLEEKKNESKI